MGNTLRVCTNCVVPHYENCGTCFGWGLYESDRGNGLVPVTASEARSRKPRRFRTCPECNSTIDGVPSPDQEYRDD